MAEIIEALKAGWEWFMSTPLPFDTSSTFLKIAEIDWEQLVPLLEEYINILFGGI